MPFPTQAIPTTDVKCRFKEDYISAGVNRKLAGYPLGIFRGFLPVVTGPTSLDLTADATFGDHVGVAEAPDGYSINVRTSGTFSLDFSPVNFTNDPVLFVMLQVFYDPQGATPTQANIITVPATAVPGPGSPTFSQQVKICEITKPGAQILVDVSVPAKRQEPVAYAGVTLGFMPGGSIESLSEAIDTTTEVKQARTGLRVPQLTNGSGGACTLQFTQNSAIVTSVPAASNAFLSEVSSGDTLAAPGGGFVVVQSVATNQITLNAIFTGLTTTLSPIPHGFGQLDLRLDAELAGGGVNGMASRLALDSRAILGIDRVTPAPASPSPYSIWSGAGGSANVSSDFRSTQLGITLGPPPTFQAAMGAKGVIVASLGQHGAGTNGPDDGTHSLVHLTDLFNNEMMDPATYDKFVGKLGYHTRAIDGNPVDDSGDPAFPFPTNPVTTVGTGLTLTFGAGPTAVVTALATTIDFASNGQTLPQTIINVASTSGFPAAGTIFVTTSLGSQTVTYTSKTATTFLGCTGGVGVMSTGGQVNAWAPTTFSAWLAGSGPSNGGLLSFDNTGPLVEPGDIVQAPDGNFYTVLVVTPSSLTFATESPASAPTSGSITNATRIRVRVTFGKLTGALGSFATANLPANTSFRYWYSQIFDASDHPPYSDHLNIPRARAVPVIPDASTTQRGKSLFAVAEATTGGVITTPGGTTALTAIQAIDHRLGRVNVGGLPSPTVAGRSVIEILGSGATTVSVVDNGVSDKVTITISSAAGGAIPSPGSGILNVNVGGSSVDGGSTSYASVNHQHGAPAYPIFRSAFATNQVSVTTPGGVLLPTFNATFTPQLAITFIVGGEGNNNFGVGFATALADANQHYCTLDGFAGTDQYAGSGAIFQSGRSAPPYGFKFTAFSAASSIVTEFSAGFGTQTWAIVAGFFAWS